MWSLFTKKAPEYLLLADHGRIRVAGESHYQSALFAAARGEVASNEPAEQLPATAAFTSEPDNKWDRQTAPGRLNRRFLSDSRIRSSHAGACRRAGEPIARGVRPSLRGFRRPDR
jgi:hypothetical protein